MRGIADDPTCKPLRDIIRDERLTVEKRTNAVTEMDKLAESGDMYDQYLMGEL